MFNILQKVHVSIPDQCNKNAVVLERIVRDYGAVYVVQFVGETDTMIVNESDLVERNDSTN